MSPHVSGFDCLWAVLTVSAYAMTQPSAFAASNSTGLTLAHASPFVCIGDVLYLIIWMALGYFHGVGLKNSLRLYRAEYGWDDENRQHGPFAVVCCLFYGLAAVPQTLRVMHMNADDIPLTSLWVFMFAISSVVLNFVPVFPPHERLSLDESHPAYHQRLTFVTRARKVRKSVFTFFGLWSCNFCILFSFLMLNGLLRYLNLGDPIQPHHLYPSRLTALSFLFLCVWPAWKMFKSLAQLQQFRNALADLRLFRISLAIMVFWIGFLLTGILPCWFVMYYFAWSGDLEDIETATRFAPAVYTGSWVVLALVAMSATLSLTVCYAYPFHRPLRSISVDATEDNGGDVEKIDDPDKRDGITDAIKNSFLSRHRPPRPFTQADIWLIFGLGHLLSYVIGFLSWAYVYG